MPREGTLASDAARVAEFCGSDGSGHEAPVDAYGRRRQRATSGSYFAACGRGRHQAAKSDQRELLCRHSGRGRHQAE